MNEKDLSTLIAKTDPNQLDSILATAAKYEKLLNAGMRWLDKLDKIGVLPAVIRAVGAKTGIQDIDKPITNPLNFQAATSTHLMLYKLLNSAEEPVIEAMYKEILLAQNAEKEKEDGGN
jgi:uncharacterized protein YjgD (DUF1641 family)